MGAVLGGFAWGLTGGGSIVLSIVGGSAGLLLLIDAGRRRYRSRQRPMAWTAGRGGGATG